MSHEIAESDANLRAYTECRAALDVALAENAEWIARAHAWAAEREQLRADNAALRQLEQLDRALTVMSITELDSARARIDSDLVPQLANMLALCLVKEDGGLYNVISWALGAAEPFGPMELLLQRVEGKSPTQLRIEAEQYSAALLAELEAARAKERALLIVAYEAWLLSKEVGEFGTIVSEQTIESLDRALLRAFGTTYVNFMAIGQEITTALGGHEAMLKARAGREDDR